MTLACENIFGYQTWEFLRPAGLYRGYGNDNGTFSQWEKLGISQVTATSAQTKTGAYADLDSMAITVTCEQGQSVMILFSFYAWGSTTAANSEVLIQLEKDGVPVTGTVRRASIFGPDPSDRTYSVLTTNYIDYNVADGIHTYHIQWSTAGPATANCADRVMTAIRLKSADE